MLNNFTVYTCRQTTFDKGRWTYDKIFDDKEHIHFYDEKNQTTSNIYFTCEIFFERRSDKNE